MDVIVDFFAKPTVLIAVLFGGSALFLFYILRLFRIEHDAQEHVKKEPVVQKKESASSGKPKKKSDRWSARDKSFSSPWLLTTLKGHTGPVLDIDYSSNGKYLASCGEEDLNTSSGSESNKENSSPPEPSPQRLSRRQRKNRTFSYKRKKMDSSKAPFDLDISEELFLQKLESYILPDKCYLECGFPVPFAYYHSPIVFYHYQHFGGNSPQLDMKNFLDSGSGNSSDSEESTSSNSEIDDLKTPAIERTCCRCRKGFFTTQFEYLTNEHCTFHPGKVIFVKQFSNNKIYYEEKRYDCCNQLKGSEGCTRANLHVWSGVAQGANGPYYDYVKTRPKKHNSNERRDAFGIDCEMCYTVAGLEVTKVTVVNVYGRVVYDTYVKPKNKIIDYNTKFSGITHKDLNKPGAAKPLKQVQNDLRGFITSDTILIGHGLENDLRGLKLIHRNIVDTSYVFQHPRGYPYRTSLKRLAKDYLGKTVQDNPNGHNSFEDAVACLELMLHKIKSQCH